jgi:hypothetical protein
MTVKGLMSHFTNYVHMGYQTVYEYDVFLRVEAGKVIDSHRVDNRNKAHANPPATIGTDQ